MSLQEHGVVLLGKTAKDCLVEVDKMLIELNGNYCNNEMYLYVFNYELNKRNG